MKHLEGKDIPSVEKNIKLVQSDLFKEESKNKLISKFNNAHKNSGYRYAFDSIVFMGDSQAEPLSLYGFLEPSSVIAEKGRTVISAKKDVSSVVKLNPQKIVMLYGVNDMLLFKTTEDFIAKYESLILSIKKQLPKTQIYVNSVYPVQAFASEKKPLFKRSPDFNTALIDLCDKLSVTYIDSTPFVVEQNDYYAPDGIHFLSSYYPIWLDFIKNQLDL
ncbi:MAG: GDSL-type esterase/lipase family protein [Proteocatella sp.]